LFTYKRVWASRDAAPDDIRQFRRDFREWATDAEALRRWSIRRRLERAVARRTPREVGFEVPQQIGATFLGDATYLRQLTDLTPPLTDEYPQRLQPNAARVSLSDPRRRPRRWATVGITTAFAAA